MSDYTVKLADGQTVDADALPPEHMLGQLITRVWDDMCKHPGRNRLLKTPADPIDRVQWQRLKTCLEHLERAQTALQAKPGDPDMTELD